MMGGTSIMMKRKIEIMGCRSKRLHSRVPGLVVISIILMCYGYVVAGEGNIGCHFVKTLCLDRSEICYDDNIFGKCLPTNGVDMEAVENEPLTEEQSRILATMLEEMQGAGLGWDHPFVQCRIQGALFSLQKDTPLPPNLCANLAPDPEILGPQSPLAIVRFTPPRDTYANEIFYPPPKRYSLSSLYNRIQSQEADATPIPYERQPNALTALLELERQKLLKEQQEDEDEEMAKRIREMKNEFLLSRMLPEVTDQGFSAPQYSPNIPWYKDERTYEAGPSEYDRTYKRNDGDKKINNIKQSSENDASPKSYFREMAAKEQSFQNLKPIYTQHGHMATPVESVAYSKLPYKRISSSPVYKVDNFDNDANDMDAAEREMMLETNTYSLKYPPKKIDGVYTEGGLVFVPNRNRQNLLLKEKARLLANMLGFTRHERLDVKKPGPLLGPPLPAKNVSQLQVDSKEEELGKQAREIQDNSLPNKKKKVVKNHSAEDHAPHTVDTEYAHVYIKNQVDSWRDGVRIVNELANILHMQGYFNYLTVQPHMVSFRVDANNPERKTASDIAKAINDARVRNNILRRLGVTVIRSGVGDKIKADDDGEVSSARIDLARRGPGLPHIIGYLMAGAGAALVVALFLLLILMRRNDKKRDKLSGLQSGSSGTESCSKDYQDLCRARMSGKGSAPEPASGGRITSLSKENERPPSSRSSTSSWCEEPALTNMDISTGHMVLSYMEDHLRNKGRLQREWEALCRYEAEPSARDAALQPQCAILNRTGAPLPYDHSRVVLNHLANAEDLDYINASTITDHDPRAPAYVAAQGPLPTTLAHFWQMIWEQGAVVIVSLCRLQENGDIACARYWPEESAEVYHIYEVHLVSEHIWCDDYLVRSFYLKNLRTSETRTVTQFHFLSWPQGGIPASAKALLDFRRKVNKSYRGRSCPIVVHGSSGAGRTGAYILLDLVLGRMNKGAREIDIAATLEHLRDQRAGLVATRQQFEFVLMAVAEEVHAILKALPANQAEKQREIEGKEQTTGSSQKKYQDNDDEQLKKGKTSSPEKDDKTVTKK